MSQIIAREHEIARLEKAYRSKSAELLAVYGRRRVGKTYLISEYFGDKGIYFELTGSYKTKLKTQLINFAEEYADVFNFGKKVAVPETWQQAFSMLRKQVQQTDPDQKVILFFDEVPWLASRKSNFLMALEHTWNRYLSRCANVIVIVCGSAASWMLKNIINNKGGLYGRLTVEIYLKPYTLKQTERFLQANGISLERKQIIDLYLAFGGIPKYLNYVTRGKSSAQIVQETCFNPAGPLTTEFNKLYRSIFESPEKYIAVIEALGKKRYGLTQKEILDLTGLKSGGAFAKLLTDLEASGFIMFAADYGRKKRGGIYRLIDEYSLFYLTWIKPALERQFRDVSANYWQRLKTSSSCYAWAGYAFEGVCLKHANNVIAGLGLSAIATTVSGWRYQAENGTDEKGAQIDLVIERADKCTNLVEIKFVDGMFTITKGYADQLRHKKQCFRLQTNTKNSLFMTMLTTYGTIENEHYFSVIDSQLTMDIFFE